MPPVGMSKVSRFSQLGDVIPDSELLHARYDFSEEDGSLPITDQTGNGNDLDSGTYTGVTESINSVQAGEYDGSDDETYGLFTTLSQPFAIFSAFRYRDTTTPASNKRIHGVADSTSRVALIADDSPSEFAYFAGSVTTSGTSLDNNNHIFGEVYDSSNSNSELRIDGTTATTSDPGTNGLAGFNIGNSDGLSEFSSLAWGETLIYDASPSELNYSEIESYLDDKWGQIL